MKEKNILIIEDDKDSRELLKIYLSKWDYKVYEGSNSSQAFELIKKHDIQIALIDWVLYGISGLDICKMIREKFNDKYIYLILITGKKSKDDVVEALSNGADDYLIKPFNFEELKVRIKAGERILKYQANLKNSYEKLYQESLLDSLTGLFNKKTILERLESEYERQQRLKNELSLILCDIDFFKQINDTYGHLIGDKVLKKIGEILRNNIRKYDSAGRYGGEEFLIILPHTNIKTAYKVAKRIKISLQNTTFNINNTKFLVTMSFGISSSNYANSSTSLLSQADQALYNAKKEGRNRIIIYNDEAISKNSFKLLSNFL